MSELALKRIKEAKETRATRLDLGNCELTKLPEELFELTWLEELNLSTASRKFFLNLKNFSWDYFNSSNTGKANNINNLSPNFKYLKNLKNLSLNGGLGTNWKINDLSPLMDLTNLIQLDISGTQVVDLEVIKGYPNLKILSATHTNISDITPLSQSLELEFLDIQHTMVNSITPLALLKKLRLLYIGRTEIADLTPIKNHKKIKWFSVEKTPIIIPPKEIAFKGIASVRNYFKQIEEQGTTVDLYEAKLIIVGEGNTGKTTLFEKLKDNNYKLQPVDETHGINIHEGLEFTHPLIGDNVFNANLWDFGGQELQYMTHQFFLTPRGLYVLMMDARKESPNLAYWFKIISLLGRDNQDSTEKVKLLLVFNKRGNTTGTPPQYQDQLKYYEDTLDVQYLEVDFAENDYRFEALQKAIQQSLVTLPIVKSQLPRLWKVVREDLREEAKKNNYITTDRYSDMCSKHGITEEADQWLLSGYLHQLGSLLHFQNDKGLMHFVILSPQWATDGVYTFLSAESISANNGRFTETAFIQLLAAKQYKKSEADLVLQLMTKNNFDICYEATEGNYVAAQLLPENRPPQYIWHKQSGALQFRYQYPIMPKGLMSRLIVRLSEYIEKRDDIEVVWKKGVILTIPTDKNNPESRCRVLMYEDDAESKSGLRQIIIEVMGTPQGHRKHALQRVREEVESLHKKWFRSIKPDEMVPCCCSECVKSDNPQLYKLENLLKLRSKGLYFNLRCFDSAEEVSTQSLLEGVYDKNEIREMENHGKY